MASQPNPVDHGTFAEAVLADLVETARAKSPKRARAAAAANTLYKELAGKPFAEQYRETVNHTMKRLGVESGDADRRAVHAIVDRLLPVVRAKNLERKIEQLLDVVADAHDPLAEVNAAIAADNAAIRQRFMREVETITSTQVAARAGHEAKNRHQTAARWKSDKRVFAVPYQGQDRFPTFQFDGEGKPRPVIREVLAVLPEIMSPWETAFWFVSSNSWLGGPAPRDHLDDTAALVEAANHENDEIGG